MAFTIKRQPPYSHNCLRYMELDFIPWLVKPDFSNYRYCQM